VEAYERAPDEGNAAWEAFALYRDLGPGRSLSIVGRQLGKSTTLLSRWSARHNWVQRAAEFDRHLDRAKVSANVEALTEMHKRHAQLAVTVQGRVVDWLTRLVNDGRVLPDRVAARMFVEAPRLERAARGALAIEEGTVWEPAPGPALRDLYVVDGAGAELTVARLIVEPPDDDEDWDDEEAADLLEAEYPDDTQEPTGEPEPAATDLPRVADSRGA
jgi:hypothetical protein